MKVLVINSGSSSLKAQLMETTTNEVLAKTYCQKIGFEDSFMDYKTKDKIVITKKMPTHKEAFQLVLDSLVDFKIGVIQSLDEIKAFGHRMVNFGDKYNKSIVITKEIYADLEKNAHYSPLHNYAALLGVKACMDLMPDKKNVGVFDTAFHSTMPEMAYMYAIPYEFYENNKIRRYGAHGTSHRYIAKRVEELYGDLKGKKIISCHIGSGSSICAIKDGVCVDTSMGFTPLAGVVMGTRSGDIDPSVIKEMMAVTGKSIEEVTDILNKKSGLLGICGLSDLREIDENLDKPKVKLAFDMLCYSIKKYIGSYSAVMNGVDYIVFTAGVGENDELVREAICTGLDYLGVDFDKEVNRTAPRGREMELTTPKSKVKVLRIPTDEESMIAFDTATLVK